ncbi:MAG: hypothetical protein FD136_1733 [Chitinophagaceae bacterium]|nr:MAG: hypothetical protein FD136_1733 [Chitinophagaceae bacterium]
MQISTKQILNILYVLSLIILIGLCIESGGFITNTLYALFINTSVVSHFWGHLDLSGLYEYDHGHFYVITVYMIIVALAKTLMFYLIVKILHDKKINMDQPFNKELGRFAFNLAYLALLIGLFSSWGVKYSLWLEGFNIKMPNVESLRMGGADVWLFMSVMLYVIAQIFKRGIEIQSENDLTV